ncbi:hypothetical protein H0B56_08515 [Haloechinothrix sp. YIM 98757]|uniref:Uncharacterized protein n=1 Tax=Haloechinothrix aidingensis TaxID=2752311 RepID=A0A838A9B6_9PSEU|nr:hypothetical protein [Haloechinothrix aidingensis]MBA0125577.1 hypothetical protein [Haloechinothrix aidingensis]
MSWEDFYRRRDTIAAVLHAAERAPDGPLPFTEVGAGQVFRDERELLLALHYHWMQLMTGRLRAELGRPDDGDASGEGGDDLSGDPSDGVSRAWRRAADEHPTLRAVLDANLERYPDVGTAALEREQRVLAVAAGLAEPDESPAEAARVGAAFLALTRHGAAHGAARSERSKGQVLRMLARSA